MGVTGIGGFFFRAKDPEALRAWYVEHLGVGSAPYGSWETQAGPSVAGRGGRLTFDDLLQGGDDDEADRIDDADC